MALEAQQVVSAVTLAGGGGIIAIAIKSLAFDKRGEGKALIDGYREGLEEHSKQTDVTISALEDRMESMRVEHARDVAELRGQIDRLTAAMVKLLVLVDPTRTAEAAAILVELHLSPPRP